MYEYIAINAPTADWILAQSARKAALSSALAELADLSGASGGVVSLGALRVAAPKQASVIVVWNVDLLTGLGYEKWGFCRLSGENSLLSSIDISSEVFERFLQVVSLRLSGLKLEDRMIHRHIEDDMHTCLAGRGSIARQFALAFSDKPVESEAGKIPNILAIGPMKVVVGTLPPSLKVERKRVAIFISELASLLATLHTRPSVEAPSLVSMRNVFQPATQMVLEYEPGLPAFPVFQERNAVVAPLTYEQWLAPKSPLSTEQRTILESDIILRSPVRLIGPAGSGKTLLMQLLAMRRLKAFEKDEAPCRLKNGLLNWDVMRLPSPKRECRSWMC